MEKTIRVRVLGREYALRVHEEDEAATREIATHVEQKMQAFRQAHPEQSEVTTAVIVALSFAEELYSTREVLAGELDELSRHLEGLLPGSGDGAPPAGEER